MFKKNYLIWMNTIIVFLFLCSFVLIQYNDTRYYNELASAQVKNDVKLAADNIRVGLESVTSQQRIVAETMSNDLYLRNWLLHEPDRSYNHRVPKTLRQALLADDSDWAYNYHDLYSYLKNYQQNYGYTNVFLVSTKTGCYYYNDGLNKVVNKKSHFDSWYYNFLDLKKSYDIQFDRDETKDYQLSVFVNYRITDEHGKLLGVVGTAQKVSEIDDNVKILEQQGKLKVYITNMGNAHNSFDESRGYYKKKEDLMELLGLSESELDGLEDKAQVLTDGNYMISSSPVKSLNWCIFTVKDTEEMMHTFLIRSRNGFIYVFITVLISGLLSFLMMGWINHTLFFSANVDETTRLPNRKSFRYIYEKKVKRRKRRVYSLAMIDVDNFKVYNDTQGHLYGNAILHYVAVHLKEMFQDIGVVARWGGDEFILLSYQSPARTKDLVDRLNTYLKEQTEIASISLSVGVTVIDPKHPLEDIMENADKALYAAKEAGKGCSRIY